MEVTKEGRDQMELVTLVLVGGWEATVFSVVSTCVCLCGGVHKYMGPISISKLTQYPSEHTV